MHADDEAGLPRNSHCINPAGALFPTTSPAMLQISADSKSSGVSMLYTRRQTNLIHSVSAPFSIHTSRGEGSNERVKASPRRTALRSAAPSRRADSVGRGEQRKERSWGRRGVGALVKTALAEDFPIIFYVISTV